MHKDAIPLTAFCTPTRLFVWLVMPQGNSTAPGWFVEVINEVINEVGKVIDPVAAYLDDAIVFAVDPFFHVANMKDFFLRLRKHNVKLSLSNATIGTTDADFFGHAISTAGIMLNTQKWKI